MAFFKTKPNVDDAEKARIEFHLQQIAECVGAERLKLPVVDFQSMVSLASTSQSPEAIIGFLGKHLSHDAGGITVVTEPKPVEKCGGGG